MRVIIKGIQSLKDWIVSNCVFDMFDDIQVDIKRRKYNNYSMSWEASIEAVFTLDKIKEMLTFAQVINSSCLEQGFKGHRI